MRAWIGASVIDEPVAIAFYRTRHPYRGKDLRRPGMLDDLDSRCLQRVARRNHLIPIHEFAALRDLSTKEEAFGHMHSLDRVRVLSAKVMKKRKQTRVVIEVEMTQNDVGDAGQVDP